MAAIGPLFGVIVAGPMAGGEGDLPSYSARRLGFYGLPHRLFVTCFCLRLLRAGRSLFFLRRFDWFIPPPYHQGALSTSVVLPTDYERRGGKKYKMKDFQSYFNPSGRIPPGNWKVSGRLRSARSLRRSGRNSGKPFTFQGTLRLL